MDTVRSSPSLGSGLNTMCGRRERCENQGDRDSLRLDGMAWHGLNEMDASPQRVDVFMFVEFQETKNISGEMN